MRLSRDLGYGQVSFRLNPVAHHLGKVLQGVAKGEYGESTHNNSTRKQDKFEAYLCPFIEEQSFHFYSFKYGTGGNIKVVAESMLRRESLL